LGSLADTVVAVSSVVRNAAAEVDRIPVSKLRIIFNGTDIDAARLTRSEARRQLQLDDGTFVIGALGRLAPEKDYASLVDAFARTRDEMPDVAAIVIGDGPLLEDLIQKTRRLGLDRLRFHGYCLDAVSLIPAFDVLVQPSLVEGISLSVLEAMAAGVPVIATAAGGNPEALGDGEAGVLVPVRDVGALSGAILSLARDDERRRQLAAVARRRVEEHFSIEGVARAYEALYVERARHRGVGV
jgi:glycosyltransferase involved in cell wall biosynthesis